jgi:hypothetical protein
VASCRAKRNPVQSSGLRQESQRKVRFHTKGKFSGRVLDRRLIVGVHRLRSVTMAQAPRLPLKYYSVIVAHVYYLIRLIVTVFWLTLTDHCTLLPFFVDYIAID